MQTMDWISSRVCPSAVMQTFPTRLIMPCCALPIVLLVVLVWAPAAPAVASEAALQRTQARAQDEPQRIAVFDRLPIRWSPERPEVEVMDNGVTAREFGQVLERTIALPDAPQNQRDARRILATVEITPVVLERNGRPQVHDPWTRLGRVTVVVPATGDEEAPEREIELMRFISGFGGAGRFEADVTALAPLLHGESTLRLTLSTWSDPAWEASLTLRYETEGVGYRRPVFAEPVIVPQEMTARNAVIQRTVRIPEGVGQPRLRILTTGHATDGEQANEFITSPHILRINGVEVARWRPWREDGGGRRDQNPTSGRTTIEGRQLWSSDLYRTGWVPGAIVWPMMFPLPELTAGEHTIELEIEGIRPQSPDGGYGYWTVSIAIVADEPWPHPQSPDP